jgi:hypothetical protein
VALAWITLSDYRDTRALLQLVADLFVSAALEIATKPIDRKEQAVPATAVPDLLGEAIGRDGALSIKQPPFDAASGCGRR